MGTEAVGEIVIRITTDSVKDELWARLFLLPHNQVNKIHERPPIHIDWVRFPRTLYQIA